MSDLMVDWIYLPEGQKAISLSDSLHDAFVEEIHSDRLVRTVTLTITHPYLVEYHHLPGDHRFFICLDTVSALRCNKFRIWPGEYIVPPDASMKDQMKAGEAFNRKGREQSVDWESFEQSVNEADAYLLLLDAELAQANSSIAVKLTGYLNEDIWHQITICAESFVIHDSNGKSYALQQFLQLGEKYREAWRNNQLNLKDVTRIRRGPPFVVADEQPDQL